MSPLALSHSVVCVTSTRLSLKVYSFFDVLCIHSSGSAYLFFAFTFYQMLPTWWPTTTI